MIDTFSIRCSILRLAFSGKLSEQRIADGNARSLLSRISPKKSIEQTENTPYEIPDTWAWVKLADLYTINPKVDADDDTEAAFIPMERVNAGFDRTFSFERQSWAQASKNHTKFSDGDIAFAKISPCFENRKSFIAQDLPNGIGGGTTELIVLRQSEMLPEYTYFLVLDQRFIDTGKASYKGTVGQQRVQSDVIKNFFVPVPPYPEQHRIVARIEQAFSALDTIDALQAKYADNLAVLKSKLIDAAIQGKLTEQLPEDGTAEELYRQIQAEKQTLIKAGKIKKEKPPPEITADEIPFEIPGNWKWARLMDLCKSVMDGDHQPPPQVKEGIPFLVISNISKGAFDLTDVRHVPRDYYDSLSNERIAEKGDILFTVTGSFGIPVIVSVDGEFCFQRHMALLKPIVASAYLHLALRSAYVQKYCDEVAIGTAQRTVGIKQLRRIPIPLPPIAEQKQIVKRVSELLTVCDELKIASKRMEL